MGWVARVELEWAEERALEVTFKMFNSHVCNLHLIHLWLEVEDAVSESVEGQVHL